MRLEAAMAEQYSGSMMVDLDNTVAKVVKPYDFPQPGVFTLDVVPYFDAACWLPFVILAEAAKGGIKGSKATGITVLNSR
jgi:hypothetical protein